MYVTDYHESCPCYYCENANDKVDLLKQALINSSEWIRTHANYTDEVAQLILTENKKALSAEVN